MLESVGGDALAAAFRVIRPGGHLVWFGQAVAHARRGWTSSTTSASRAPRSATSTTWTPRTRRRATSRRSSASSSAAPCTPRSASSRTGRRPPSALAELRDRRIRGNAVLTDQGDHHMTDSTTVIERYVDAPAAGDLPAVRDSSPKTPPGGSTASSRSPATGSGRDAIIDDFLGGARSFFEPGSVQIEVTEPLRRGRPGLARVDLAGPDRRRRALREPVRGGLHGARRPDPGRPRVHGHALRLEGARTRRAPSEAIPRRSAG